MGATPGAGRRILYLQCTNPAAYPPLEHSSRILASRGWRVRFVGASFPEVASLRFAPHPGVEVRQIRFRSPGIVQKLQYLWFLAWCVLQALLWRPRWVYASDPLVAPAALVVSWLPWVRVLYHEHDSAAPGDGGSGVMALCLRARRRLARRARVCVLPNAERAAAFAEDTGTRAPVHVVWNCPERHEVRPPRGAEVGPMRVLYHGSVVEDRLPLTVVDAIAALPDAAELVVAGYEPAGGIGWGERLRERAAQLGVPDRVRVVGPVPLRHDLLALCHTCDLGLAFMPLRSGDFNLRTMAGASNKAFDYLACGLALVVSDLPDWRAMFVEPGYGFACSPEDPEALARILAWGAANRGRLREMGEEGRRRVAAEWNYEAQFAPVYARLSESETRGRELLTPVIQ